MFLYVPIFIHDAQTQIMFNDPIKNSFSLSFEYWITNKKTVDTLLEYQVDIGSAQNISTPQNLIVANQTATRNGFPNKINNVSIFDNLNVRKYHVDIYGVRYPRDGVSIEYASNDYVDQYRDLEFFYEDYVGEELLNPFMSYTDMKTRYPIQFIDLRFQADHFNPKKIELFEEYRGATINNRLFLILIRHREF